VSSGSPGQLWAVALEKNKREEEEEEEEVRLDATSYVMVYRY
jgi:hypothetical protein